MYAFRLFSYCLCMFCLTGQFPTVVRFTQFLQRLAEGPERDTFLDVAVPLSFNEHQQSPYHYKTYLSSICVGIGFLLAFLI